MTPLILLLIAISISRLEAQTFLNVNETLGSQNPFALSGLKRLIFNTGNMSVVKKGGNISDFKLTNIRTMNFTNITATPELKDVDNTKLTLYPNPVRNSLQIQYESKNAENVFIQIMNVQGKIIYQQNISNQTGINKVDIRVESYQNGLYLCRLHHDNILEVSKFVKL